MPNQRLSVVPYAIFLALFVLGPRPAVAQTLPEYLPTQYRPYLKHFADRRSLPERMLNLAGLTSEEYGRGFALVAGVSKYPRIAGPSGNLAPAAEDVRKLITYLRTYEKIDEIVVLADEQVTQENLSFFLERYFPRRLREFPRSRFLFAYSGHGTTQNGRGYLLTSEASNLTDTFNSVSMVTLRAMFQQVVDSGFHVLALINACYSGDFVKRSFGDVHFIPRHAGAHAITAGGTKELTWHDGSVGTGSVFFEKFFAALEGRAGKGGIVTVDDLAAYLRREVQISTDQQQNPLPGDLSRDGSLGGFFFFNRLPLIEQKLLPRWDAAKGVPFGDSVASTPSPAPAPQSSPPQFSPSQPPPWSPTASADPQNTLLIDTKHGRIVIKLRNDIAPKHAERLKQLAREKYYDNVPFHRVIAGFMAQTGDGQRGDGTGGSKYPNLPPEFSSVPFKRGVVGMARATDPNSANSQFFIMYAPGSFLDGKYTVVGEVLSGMDAVDKIKTGEPVPDPDRMTRVQVAADAK